MPEEFTVLDLPQIKDAISRTSAFIDCYCLNATLTEILDNPYIQRLHIDMYYENGKLPPPREFVVWVDGFDLVIQHIAEMP